LYGAKIYTGAPRWETVEALLVREGRVVRAGSRAELARQAGPAARSVDLGGGVALPGLADAHGHLSSLGAALENVDLTSCASYAELIERVRARAERAAPGSWILGRGWDQTRWSPSEFPHHAALSAAVGDHPVLLTRVDGHAALANQLALERAGLARLGLREDQVAGGRVLLGSDGMPTGVFIDNAIDLLRGVLAEPTREELRGRLLAAQAHLLALGLTAVHDMGVSPRELELLRELQRAGRWHLRVIAYLSGDRPWNPSDLAPIPRVQALQSDARARVLLAGVKLYADGALGSRGAALLEPYADEPGTRGLLVQEPASLAERLRACARDRLQPATHAIGDRANRLVLDLYGDWLLREAGALELRPRIEHAQVVHPRDWSRFEALGVVASMQPTHATSDMRWAEARLGSERLAGAYAWRELGLASGLLALGSDFPVESADPLLGLYAARTRTDALGEPSGGWLAEQRLSAAEALSGYTLGAARAARLERELGGLRAGCAADLTLLDFDPLECDAAELLNAHARQVWIAGVRVLPDPAP
jgi:hypothetical protein